MRDEGENGGEVDLGKSSEIDRLVAIIEVCATQAERSFLASQAAKQAAERSEQMVADIKKAVGKLEIYTGSVPKGVLGLIGMAAAIGATVGGVMTYLLR